MQKLTISQKSYIAGFLDGDGSVYVRLRKNDTYKYKYQIAPYIVFYQKSEYLNFLQGIKNLLKIGYIRTRKDGMAEYVIGDVKSLKSFSMTINRYSILKSRQLKLMLKILQIKEKVKNAKDFVKLCEIIDKFKSLNYSKKRINTSKEVRKLLIDKKLLTP